DRDGVGVGGGDIWGALGGRGAGRGAGVADGAGIHLGLRQGGGRAAGRGAADRQVVGEAVAVFVGEAGECDRSELVVGRRDVEQRDVAGVGDGVVVDDLVAGILAVGVEVEHAAVLF